MEIPANIVSTAIPETVKAWWMPAEKTEYPDGPWQGEPDKVQWVDRATRLPCLIVRGPVGALCGYAGVTPGHPLFRKPSHDEGVQDLSCARDINYARGCDHYPDPSQGICHIPEPGASDDVWWFGFDCAHCFDLVPGFLHLFQYGEVRLLGLKYRDIDWAARAVTKLAAQLHQRG
jgi:hypothetical protein